MRIGFILLLLSFSLVGFAQKSEAYQALLDSALSISAQGKLQVAEEYYKKVLKLDPTNQMNSLVWGNLGSVQQRLDKIEDALQSYTMALNLEPSLTNVLLQRANLYLDKNDQAHALADYSAVLDKEPENAEALVNRAYLRMEKRMFPEARIDFDALLTHYPQHRQGELGMAILSQKQERYKEAADRFAVLIERYPNDATLYEARGNMERESKQYELALIDYEEAGRISKDPVYHLMQAMVYLDQNKKKTARIMINRAAQAGMRKAVLQEFYDMCK